MIGGVLMGTKKAILNALLHRTYGKRLANLIGVLRNAWANHLYDMFIAGAKGFYFFQDCFEDPAMRTSPACTG